MRMPIASRVVFTLTIVASVLTACGVGLDTLITEDGYRYTLWVARSTMPGIDALIIDPKENKLVSRNTFTDPSVSDGVVDLAIPTSQEGLVSLNAGTTGMQLQMWKISEQGQKLSYLTAASVSVGTAGKSVIFHPTAPSFAQVISTYGSTLGINSLQVDWSTGTLGVAQGTTVGSSVMPIQLIANPKHTSLLFSAGTSNPVYSSFLSSGVPQASSPTSVMNVGALARGKAADVLTAVNAGSQITIYQATNAGTLISPVAGPVAQAAVLHLAMHPSENFLAVAGNEATGGGSVRIYPYADLTTGGAVVDHETIGVDARDMAFDSEGRLLAVSDCGSNLIYVFTVNSSSSDSGFLEAVTGSPFSVSGCPSGLAWTQFKK